MALVDLHRLLPHSGLLSGGVSPPRWCRGGAQDETGSSTVQQVTGVSMPELPVAASVPLPGRKSSVEPQKEPFINSLHLITRIMLSKHT